MAVADSSSRSPCTCPSAPLPPPSSPSAFANRGRGGQVGQVKGNVVPKAPNFAHRSPRCAARGHLDALAQPPWKGTALQPRPRGARHG
eukprot:6631401-Pyramimonas_sp.AAC.2